MNEERGREGRKEKGERKRERERKRDLDTVEFTD